MNIDVSMVVVLLVKQLSVFLVHPHLRKQQEKKLTKKNPLLEGKIFK